MEANKFYGPKPSYRIMKALMKDNNHVAFYQHGMNLKHMIGEGEKQTIHFNR